MLLMDLGKPLIVQIFIVQNRFAKVWGILHFNRSFNVIINVNINIINVRFKIINVIF